MQIAAAQDVLLSGTSGFTELAGADHVHDGHAGDGDRGGTGPVASSSSPSAMASPKYAQVECVADDAAPHPRARLAAVKDADPGRRFPEVLNSWSNPGRRTPMTSAIMFGGHTSAIPSPMPNQPRNCDVPIAAIPFALDVERENPELRLE